MSMSLFASMGISASGMSAEQTRMEAAAQNLSIVHVAARPGDTSVATRTVQITPRGKIPGEDPAFQALMQGNEDQRGVSAEVLTAPAQQRLQYEPGHPFADANGMVAYPDVNFLDQMVSMMSASRAFEANVTAYVEARTMLQKALEIGR